MTFEEKKKFCLETIVITGLVFFGGFCAYKNDMTNAAWAFGLAGGYVFKNGIKKTNNAAEKKE